MNPATDFRHWMPGWTVTSIHGRWLVAHRMAAVEGARRGPDVLFLKLAPRSWWCFRTHAASGHATTPNAALTGAEGYVSVPLGAGLTAFRRAVVQAPPVLAERFAGLRATRMLLLAL